MTFSEDLYADVCVLRPVGRITNEVAGTFQDQVAATVDRSPTAQVVLDFAALDYVSSGGLRGVAKGARLCRERGGQLAVAALTSVVKEIFEISRFHQVVSVHGSLTNALEELSADALVSYLNRQG